MADRLDRVEIGADRDDVVVRHLRIRRVRHRGIKPRAVGPHAVAHRVVELLVGPRSDAGLGVRRDVRRGDVAERRLDRATAGERLAAVLDRVTRHAIGGGGEIAALFDLREILAAGLRGTGGNAAAPKRLPRTRL